MQQDKPCQTTFDTGAPKKISGAFCTMKGPHSVPVALSPLRLLTILPSHRPSDLKHRGNREGPKRSHEKFQGSTWSPTRALEDRPRSSKELPQGARELPRQPGELLGTLRESAGTLGQDETLRRFRKHNTDPKPVAETVAIYAPQPMPADSRSTFAD